MSQKHKTCQHCADRTVEPNCHMTCEGYIQRKEAKEEARKAKKFEDKCVECAVLGKQRIGRALKAGRIIRG